MNKTKLELLCPARDSEAGKLAINYGADAVYIGASKFGARAAAGNSVEDIGSLIEYAHIFGAKVYVVLNTLLYENELSEVKTLIEALWKAGMDALIVQDMAILEMDLPEIPLFASTQTHNYQLDRIKFLENSGFERIILARELSLREIKNIRKETSAELEAFVHGALCVSLSGQCNFSQAMCGRSANRGECAQACRMPFDLLDAKDRILLKNKHLLSLKDLNASEKIYDMIEAGISSFKIEGRLKDNAYLINNTAFYRRILDSYIRQNTDYERASSGYTELSFEPDPEKTFNRGFTDYFIQHRQQGITSFESPKSKGKYLGVVKDIRQNSIHIETNEKFSNGDGLCFLTEKDELSGFQIEFQEGKYIRVNDTKGLKIGSRIYRNFDKEFTNSLETNKDKRLLNVKIQLSEYENGFALSAEDEDLINIELKFETEKQAANDKLKSEENIRKQLTKTGDSVFKVTALDIQLSKMYFIPISVLNEMRRKLFEQLLQKRLSNYRRKPAKTNRDTVKYFDTGLNYSGNVSNSLSKIFYEKRGVEVKEMAFELLSKSHQSGKTLMTTRYCLKFELGICPSKQKDSGAEKPEEPLFLRDRNRKYKLEFDCDACMMHVKF